MDEGSVSDLMNGSKAVKMPKKQQIYFTSDWHIGHEAVLEFSKRPFSSVKSMSEGLISRYNATVPPEGTCFFLGDMGLCTADALSEVLKQLNGIKVCILGNHDRGAVAMKQLGFDLVLSGASLFIGNELVTLTHCPLTGIVRENTEGMRGAQEGEAWHGEYRHAKFSTVDQGQFHLHGHIHSPNRGKSTKILGRQFDVGVDANNYTPVSLSQIESWIAHTKREEADDTTD